MFYVIFAEDNSDSFEKRRSVRVAHLKRLEVLANEGRLITAGPLLEHDDENPLTAGIKGSLIIAQFNNLQEAQEWAVADPYTTAQVYSRVTVFPYKKVFPKE